MWPSTSPASHSSQKVAKITEGGGTKRPLAQCFQTTNSQIAATLSLREGTVKSYLQSAMGKLDASTRHAAGARARRAGILP